MWTEGEAQSVMVMGPRGGEPEVPQVMDGCDARGTPGCARGRNNEGEEEADKWIERIYSSCTRTGGKLFGTTREKAGMIPLGFVAALREGDPAARHGRVKQIPFLLAGC